MKRQRGGKPRSGAKRRRRVLVVTGARAEFGLLRPVMDAIRRHPRLELLVACAGAHWLAPARTWREVRDAYGIDARIPMQRAGGGASSRLEDARATARGVDGVARAIARLKPDWVVVLGDRIEAFAAASAASIAGVAVCHIHGGDRAEGIADEAMRHAITKLSHLHCAATTQSAERIVQMGERPQHVHVTGSPAIDGLDKIKPMGDREAAKLGDPRVVVLLHPSGLDAKNEARMADEVMGEARWLYMDRVLVLTPNHDPGREAILRAIRPRANQFHVRDHLPRPQFLALLSRLARKVRLGRTASRGVLLGNSSAGLIEAAALRTPVVNVGPRQDGRERGGNVVDVPYSKDRFWGVSTLEDAIGKARFGLNPPKAHPYGDGRAGPRIAALLAKVDPSAAALLRKHNAY